MDGYDGVGNVLGEQDQNGISAETDQLRNASRFSAVGFGRNPVLILFAQHIAHAIMDISR